LLPHVFDRFRQGDSSITRHSGGLGLGLALVREIVTLHAGTVCAHSAGTGYGARFVVTLPARHSWKATEVLASTEV
ncbi:ATP-binding protein, partial [Pseudomonas aeruginosa]